MIELKNNPAGNFFLLAGPCVIEGEEMAMRIAERPKPKKKPVVEYDPIKP